jgi:hypothetical protein
LEVKERSMKNKVIVWLLGLAGLAIPGFAQSGLPLPSPIEKELAARASNVTEVTLGKNMLGFAKRLIEGLDGIYVREYEFDKEGQYTAVDVEKLRSYFEAGGEWSSIVRERDKKSGESTDVMMKMVNGQPHGLFVLDAEPKELSIVLILGPVKMEDLSRLSGIGGLGVLGDLEGNGNKNKDKEKAKAPKAKTGGDE